MSHGSGGRVALIGGTVFGWNDDEPTPATVVIEGGRVSSIGGDPDLEGARVIDCTGLLVGPGLVDLHTHLFNGFGNIAIDVESAHYRRGVVAAVDAGSAGSATFAGFKSAIIDTAPIPVFVYLNASSIGLIDWRHGELLDPSVCHTDDTIAVARAFPREVRGVKVRLSRNAAGAEALDYLELAIQAAAGADIPVMVHIGDSAVSIDQIVDRLRPGDIVTHAFHGKPEGILADGRVRPSFRAARARGVLFDVGHGTTNLSYDIARRAIAEGFPPDLISSDLAARNLRTSAFDLPTVVSKLIALGMTTADAWRAASREPARVLGIDGAGYGRIEVGDVARIVIFRMETEADDLVDAAGEALAVRRLEPERVIDGATEFAAAPWNSEVRDAA
jgi:dihydroorotase